MSYVLDSPTMIAYLLDEPGADIVEQEVVAAAAGESCFAHAANLCEVFYEFYRSGELIGARTALHDIKVMGIRTRRDFNNGFCEEAATLKAVHRRLPIVSVSR